jgi:hypothetical protein
VRREILFRRVVSFRHHLYKQESSTPATPSRAARVRNTQHASRITPSFIFIVVRSTPELEEPQPVAAPVETTVSYHAELLRGETGERSVVGLEHVTIGDEVKSLSVHLGQETPEPEKPRSEEVKQHEQKLVQKDRSKWSDVGDWSHYLLLQQANLRAMPSADRKGIVILPPNRIEIKGGRSSSFRSLLFDSASDNHVTSPLGERVAQPPQSRQSATVLSDLLTGLAPPAPCSKCKTPLQSDWLFCPKCGAKNEQTKAQGWKFCPSCGKPLSAGTTLNSTTTRRTR